jgi:hypothetical protein
MMRRLALLLLTCLALPVTARAAVSTESFGPRFGFSVDPDQVVLGGQMTFGEIAPSISFTPNAEFGFGDNQTVIALNMDFHYRLDLRGSEWSPYLGFGVGVNFDSFDRPAPFRDDSETNVGGNFILGANVPTRSGSKFFTELKLGLGDIPSLKMLAGFNFRTGR